MRLEEVSEIKQSAEPTQVNKWLKEGYKLLRIFNARVKSMETETISPIYVLGKGGE